jgi:drug/metabolite transporter (DMT)-like permease
MPNAPREIISLLEIAVARGLITPDQRASLQSLAAEAGEPPRELPRGFNWVTVAYALGAMLVVFAGGWFLAQRWLMLGPAGVLAVVVVYAAVAGVASRWLERREFHEAAGIAAMVAVALTPVAVWALESISGWWPAETWGRPYYPDYQPAEASRWLVAELCTILAALLILRRRTWSAVVFPVAVALFGLVMHLPRALDLDLTPVLERWLTMTGALLVCAIADATDRHVPRQSIPGRGDVAFPLWLTGLFALALAILSMWPVAGALRHALPVLALGSMAVALFMGRRTHLVFGVFAIFMYLVYLAGEVFRSTAYFPIVLALLGGAVLAATVWLQRRFPELASRLGARPDRRGGLPGSPVMPWMFVVLALGITLLSIPDAIEERINRDFQQRLYILRLHSGSLRAAPSRPIPTRPRADTVQSAPGES